MSGPVGPGRIDPDTGQKVYRVAMIGECFLDRPMRFSTWIARPLMLVDPIYVKVIELWVKALEATADVSMLSAQGFGRRVDCVSVEGLMPGSSPRDAMVRARPHLEAILRALRYRQIRSGRLLAVIASDDSGEEQAVVASDFKNLTQAITQLETTEAVSDGSDWSAESVQWIAQAIEQSPAGATLVDLFLEALDDPSPEGSIVRLWSVLEIVSDRFPDPDPARKKGRDLRQVQACLGHLQLGDYLDLAAMYGVRSGFVHEGLRQDQQVREEQRSEMVHLVFQALLRSSFATVDPTSAPYVDDPEAISLQIIHRQPDDGPSAGTPQSDAGA